MIIKTINFKNINETALLKIIEIRLKEIQKKSINYLESKVLIRCIESALTVIHDIESYKTTTIKSMKQRLIECYEDAVKNKMKYIGYITTLTTDDVYSDYVISSIEKFQVNIQYLNTFNDDLVKMTNKRFKITAFCSGDSFSEIEEKINKFEKGEFINE